MNTKKFTLSLAYFLLCFAGQSTLANTAISQAQLETNLQEFKLQPTFNLWGYTGRQTIGDAQSLIPLLGDQNNALYLVGEGKISKNNNSWLVGFGGGYRKIINNHLLGGYLVIDYSDTPLHDKFFLANPGVESLGKVWDFRINGYIPISKSRWSENHCSSSQEWEDEVGIYNDVRFTAHTEYDHKIGISQYTHKELNIALGLDAEIGRIIASVNDNDLKAYVGGYHFDTKDLGSINGISGRITYQMNNYIGVEAIDTYDDYRHNTAMLGIKLSIGGFNNKQHKQFGIAARLLDPIEHNIATLANGYATPIKTVRKITSVYTKSPQEKIEHDNLWFFKPSVNNSAKIVQGSGTYEDPFIGFTPLTNLASNNYDIINQNIGSIDHCPLLYFTPGTYHFSRFRSREINNRFNLPNGWSMYGRTADYRTPATGAKRALFVGGLDLVYAKGRRDAKIILNSISIVNSKGSNFPNKGIGGENATLYVKNASDVVLQNTEIQNNVSDKSGTAVGIYVRNSNINFAKLNNLENGINSVSSNTNGNNNDSIGIYLDSYAVANDTTITNTMNFNGGKNYISGNADRFGYGIDVYSHAVGNNVNVNTTINFNAGENSVIGGGDNNGYGIYARSNALSGGHTANIINFNGGKNNIKGQSIHEGYGVEVSSYASNDDANSSSQVTADTSINFNGGENSINGDGGYDDAGYGINAEAYVSNDNPLFGNVAIAKTAINFNYGKSTVSGNGGNDGYGIDISSSADSYAHNNAANNHITAITAVNFNGGENNISGEGANHSYGITASSFAESDAPYGHNNIATANAIIDFSSGKNSINGKNSSHSYGIYTETDANESGYGTAIADAIIKFLNDENHKVTIEANGKTRYGIYTQQPGTSIKDKNNNNITTANIENYVIFVSNKNNNDKANGYAVQLNGLPWLLQWSASSY